MVGGRKWERFLWGGKRKGRGLLTPTVSDNWTDRRPAVVLHVVDWISLKSVLLRHVIPSDPGRCFFSFLSPSLFFSYTLHSDKILHQRIFAKKIFTIYIHNSAKSLLILAKVSYGFHKFYFYFHPTMELWCFLEF